MHLWHIIQRFAPFFFRLAAYSIVFTFYLKFWILIIYFTIGATITWTKPSPQRGPLNIFDSTVRTIIKGFVYGPELHLVWDFTLDGEVLDRVSWKVNGVRIGKKTAAGIVIIFQNFEEDFNISRSDPATLIVYNVTAADGVKFTCEVETDIKVWQDIIAVVIYGG